MNRQIVLMICGLLLPGFLLAQQQETRPYREHKVYFENTVNELNVYKLYGRFDGNTAFILGGIQGDEPGGFMSADLYPNLVLERGNIIVIPRANFHSIIQNSRGVNGDMNRRFDNDTPEDIDDRIVEVIKQLMGESDIFLNLHDGWGYFRETYIDDMHNPDRYGQSIIADASMYVFEDDTLRLEQMAQNVIDQMNLKISDEEHLYHFMNTRTLANDTEHPEQLQSATCFALTTYGIPAFGIETSKNLSDLEEKIRYHNYAINEFLKLMKIEPEHPAIIYEPPSLVYMIVSINDGPHQLIQPGQSINITPGDEVTVHHIESNYPRGLSCDIVGVGNDNDYQTPLRIQNSTTITARKDNATIGHINITVDPVHYELMTYLFEVNGKKEAILHNQILEVSRGDHVKILNVLFEGSNGSDFRVNLKGYVPPGDINIGEDREYTIDTTTLNWAKYSLNGDGKVYPIIVSKGDQEVSRAFLSLN